jgi:hypothetical protein
MALLEVQYVDLLEDFRSDLICHLNDPICAQHLLGAEIKRLDG